MNTGKIIKAVITFDGFSRFEAIRNEAKGNFDVYIMEVGGKPEEKPYHIGDMPNADAAIAAAIACNVETIKELSIERGVKVALIPAKIEIIREGDETLH